MHSSRHIVNPKTSPIGRSVGNSLPKSYWKVKAVRPGNILRFPWDEEEKKDTSVTDEEMQRLRAKAKEVESQLNTNKDV